MVIFLKLPIRAEMPSRSELSSGPNWVAHHHPLPIHILLWDFLWLFALAGRDGQTLTWPFPLGLVWQSKGPWEGQADLRIHISFPSPQGVTRSLPPLALFLQGGGWHFEGAAGRKACESSRSFLIPILWVGSDFSSPNLCIPREEQYGESTPLWPFPHILRSWCRKRTVVWWV